MAILRHEPELFPEGLFELSAIDQPWWVARVRSRHEKALARHLLPHGVPFYLPQSERYVRRSGRSFTSYLPLFPGYVFFRGDRSSRLVALQSQVIHEILSVDDQARLSDELRQLRSLQEAGVPIVPVPSFFPGDGVLVTEGPFRGYSGIVLREKGHSRLIVSISFLRKAVAVELEAYALAADRRQLNRAAVA